MGTMALKQISLTILTLTLAVLHSFGQSAKISGKIFNAKNEPVSGASVRISGANQGGTSSDVEGRYTLSVPATAKPEIEISAVGYESKLIGDLDLKPGVVTTLDIILEISKRSLAEVTVTAPRTSLRKESVNSLLQFQKNTYSVAQVISAEAIRRSPDRNTGEVLKRVPGTSIQEGKYLVVRGLADRYNQAMLNGVLLSSTEPDRKTFSSTFFQPQ